MRKWRGGNRSGMAKHVEIRRSVDDHLKNLRNRASEMRLLLWRKGAMADPSVLMHGMDEIFESTIELETLLTRERMAAASKTTKAPEGANT